MLARLLYVVSSSVDGVARQGRPALARNLLHGR
jgi:hypothetical protein